MRIDRVPGRRKSTKPIPLPWYATGEVRWGPASPLRGSRGAQTNPHSCPLPEYWARERGHTEPMPSVQHRFIPALARWNDMLNPRSGFRFLQPSVSTDGGMTKATHMRVYLDHPLYGDPPAEVRRQRRRECLQLAAMYCALGRRGLYAHATVAQVLYLRLPSPPHPCGRPSPEYWTPVRR